MVGTNDTHQKILKRIFKADLGKKDQLDRQLREIKEYEEYCETNTITPNVTQQAHIDKVKALQVSYDNQIRILNNETKLIDME